MSRFVARPPFFDHIVCIHASMVFFDPPFLIKDVNMATEMISKYKSGIQC